MFDMLLLVLGDGLLIFVIVLVMLVVWLWVCCVMILVLLMYGMLWMFYGLVLILVLDFYVLVLVLMCCVGVWIGLDVELVLVVWCEQNLLQVDCLVCEFGFKCFWVEQWYDVGLWVGEVLDKCWLLVLDEVMSFCVDLVKVIDIGVVNRNCW